MEKTKDNYIYEFDGRYFGPLEKEHIYKLKSWRNSQMKILRQYTPLSNFHQKDWYTYIKKDPNQVLFSIMIKKNNKLKLIGYCGITNIDFKNRRGEISFLVDPRRSENSVRCKKDFFSSLRMLCEYGFEELNLNRIFTETYNFRKLYIKILEKFGFKLEGELREQYFTESKYYNAQIHSILNKEWQKLKRFKRKI